MESSKSDSPTAVLEYAARTVDFVHTALGIELEYDSDTLPVVDHYLTQVPTAEEAAVDLVVAAAGAYFGEVVIRHIGGRWEADGDASGWRVVLPIGVSFVPSEVVRAAILRSEEYDTPFDVPAVLRDFAEDALARMGDVGTDVYYSLCGRLDTLEHLHSVLVAVAAERKAQTN